MKLLFLIFHFSLFFFLPETKVLFAQELRIGNYPDGTLRYKGYFKEGKPVGEMTRFYPDGQVKARMNHRGDSVDVVLYSRDGAFSSSGLYVGRKKAGKWEYRKEDRLLATEEYQNDRLHGWVIHYFASGGLAGKKCWKDGRQDGSWELFYVNGKLRLQGFFTEGKLNGKFKAYRYDGVLCTEGEYRNDQKEGKWIYYDEQGTSLKEMVYHAGRPENADSLEMEESRYLDKLVEEGKKIPDPAVFADDPEVYMKLTGMEF